MICSRSGWRGFSVDRRLPLSPSIRKRMGGCSSDSDKRMVGISAARLHKGVYRLNFLEVDGILLCDEQKPLLHTKAAKMPMIYGDGALIISSEGLLLKPYSLVGSLSNSAREKLTISLDC